MISRTLTLLLAGGALCACTTTGNVERNTAGGAALGGLAGAAIGNNVGDGNAGRGAAIGAAVGGAAGAVRGYGQDQKIADCRAVGRDVQTYRDYNSGDYYYYVPGSNRTCWTDGRPRSG